MNGTESRDWTKTCKMAFSRTAGGVARTSAREGAAGAAALTRRAARQGQKPATWRALGPPGPHRAKRAGGRAGGVRESAAAGPRAQPAGSRTRWARSARALSGPHSSRPARAAPARPTPSALGTHRETGPFGFCPRWGLLGVPAASRRRFLPDGLGLARWRQLQLRSPTEPDSAREGPALGPSGEAGAEGGTSGRKWKGVSPTRKKAKFIQGGRGINCRGLCGCQRQGTRDKLTVYTGILLVQGQISNNYKLGGQIGHAQACSA